MLVHQAYRFALDPTPAQEQALLSHCGAARFAFNWGLDRVRAGLAQREAERSYGVAEELLTPVPWSLYALRREWNRAKSEVAPWWRANSKESYNSGLYGLARALSGFTESRRGRRRGKPVGFPRFRAKHRAVRSCRFTTGVMRLEADRRHVTLPRLGRIRSHESTRKLARRLEAGTARIVAATVGYRGGRWFVALTCQVRRSDPAPARPGQAVGVDVGVCALAVLSTGQTVPNPRHHSRALARLRRLNKQLARRQGPRGRDGARRAPSRRWQKTSTAVARQHARVANARRDGLHKISTMLAGRYGTVVVEDLNLAGMLKNRRLSRAIADLGLAELRRQLGVQDHLGRRSAGPGRPVLSLQQDLLAVPDGENQAVAGHPDLHLHRMRTGPGPGPQRRPEPGRPGGHRRPELRGDAKRPPRSGKTRHPCRARTDETGTPTHRWGNAASATRQLPDHHPINHP